MNADRYLEEKAIAAQAPKAAAKRPSPYSKARAAAPQPGDPVPAPSIALGETQPGFPEEMMQMPSLHADPSIGAPIRYPGMNAWGIEDMKKGGYGDTRGSELQKNVYQTPEEFLKHQNEVMGSPAIQGLMQGADAQQELAKNFLEHYPKGQADMSSLMGLADYMAHGEGHALQSYKKPMSYEEIAGNVSNLLGKAQTARQQATQLGMDQAGPLKSGQAGVDDKQQVSSERDTGYKIPHPPMMNPFQVYQGVGRSWAENPDVKSANDDVKAVNNAYLALQNPSWLADTSLKASIIQGMGVNRITQNELSMYGNGSPDLLNRASVAFSRAMNGSSLSESDRHTIQEFADARLRMAQNKFQEKQQQFQATYGGFLPHEAINNITNQGTSKPLVQPHDPEADAKAHRERVDAIFNKMMEGAPK